MGNIKHIYIYIDIKTDRLIDTQRQYLFRKKRVTDAAFTSSLLNNAQKEDIIFFKIDQFEFKALIPESYSFIKAP